MSQTTKTNLLSSSGKGRNTSCMGSTHLQTKLYPHIKWRIDSSSSNCICGTMLLNGDPINITNLFQESGDTRTNKKHENVFQDLPRDFKPNRVIEHVIEVKPDLTPINAKPH